MNRSRRANLTSPSRRSRPAWIRFAVATLTLGVAALAQAQEVDLGQSAQNFIETGTGSLSPFYGQWSLTQGNCLDTSIVTCTLSGNFTSAIPRLTSGTYTFVTTYAAPNLAPIGVSSTYNGGTNGNYFNYYFIDNSTNMVVTLNPTNGTPVVADLVTNGSIVNSTFAFNYVGTPTCTGVTSCDPFDVGLVRGATYASPVTTTFDLPQAVPLPGSLVLILSGLAGVGLMRRRA